MGKEELVFTRHAKERALERMLGMKPPHENAMANAVEELILINLTWHPIKEVWRMESYRLELVIKEAHGAYLVVTVKPIAKNFYQYDKTPKRRKKR